jgi:hypothetical protein
MLGVNQCFPGALSRTFQAMCFSPEYEHVSFPHRGSFFVSHNSSSLTYNNLLAKRRPARNDIYKNCTLGFLVNANSHILKKRG